MHLIFLVHYGFKDVKYAQTPIILHCKLLCIFFLVKVQWPNETPYTIWFLVVVFSANHIQIITPRTWNTSTKTRFNVLLSKSQDFNCNTVFHTEIIQTQLDDSCKTFFHSRLWCIQRSSPIPFLFKPPDNVYSFNRGLKITTQTREVWLRNKCRIFQTENLKICRSTKSKSKLL